MQSANTIRIGMEFAISKQFAKSRGYADPDALMMAVSTQEDPPTCGRDIHLFTFRTPSFRYHHYVTHALVRFCNKVLKTFFTSDALQIFSYNMQMYKFIGMIHIIRWAFNRGNHLTIYYIRTLLSTDGLTWHDVFAWHPYSNSVMKVSRASFTASLHRLQVEPGRPGAEVQKKNPMGDQPLRCPNRVVWVSEPSAVPWWWCGDLFWCGWLQGAMK